MSALTLHARYIDPECSRISSYFCRAFILIGGKSLQYCLLDTERNAFIALADYRLENASSKNEMKPDELRQIFNDDEFLVKKYPSTHVGITSSVQTLVPLALFDEEQVKPYLSANFRLAEGLTEAVDRIPEMSACNLYMVHPGWQGMIKAAFPDALIVHRSTALLKAAGQTASTIDERPVFLLNIREDFIDICSFQGEMPAFFNSFAVNTKEDVLYYTLFTMHQLRLKPDAVHLVLSGQINEGSENYILLQQYLPWISLAAPSGFEFSPLLRQAGLHTYVELFSLALCGS
jgi:hypothetical protein